MTLFFELQHYIALISVSACAVLVLFIASADSAESPGPSISVIQQSEQPVTVKLEPVYFDFDSSSLNAAARETIRKNILKLEQFPDVKLQLVGHTDGRCSAEYSLVLGERVARAVQRYVIFLGFDPDKISILSNGNSAPAVRGNTRKARNANRRVEFVVVR